MTREERELSITYLEGIKEEYIEGYGYERHPLPEYYAIETAIKALEQEPCEDTISRQAVFKIQAKYAEYIGATKFWQMSDDIKALPPVNPQEPKTGHWIPSHIPESILDECSECGFSCGAFTFNYCPNCGAKMVETQEGGD